MYIWIYENKDAVDSILDDVAPSNFESGDRYGRYVVSTIPISVLFFFTLGVHAYETSEIC